MRAAARFLASLFDGVGTKIRKDGLASYVDLDYSAFETLDSFDPSAFNIAVQSKADGSFSALTIAGALASAAYTEQDITAGNVAVLASDGLIKINKTVGAATTVTLPASSSKNGPVKIVDWKGDAGTNNITINCSGTDKFNGNLSSWTIAADGGSVLCTPLKDGTGYAI
jgi:hypothetical protein